MPGFEGAGVVADLGAEVQSISKLAHLVILPHNLGTWREAVAVEAERAGRGSAGIDPVQAAMLKINPLTAWRFCMAMSSSSTTIG